MKKYIILFSLLLVETVMAYQPRMPRRVYPSQSPELVLPRNAETIVLFDDTGSFFFPGFNIKDGENWVYNFEKTMFIGEVSINCDGARDGDVLDVYANGVYINSLTVFDRNRTLTAKVNARMNSLELLARSGSIDIKKVFVRTTGRHYGGGGGVGGAYELGGNASVIIELVRELREYVADDDYSFVLAPIKVAAGSLLAESNGSGDSSESTIAKARELIRLVKANEENLTRIGQIDIAFELIQDLQTLVKEIEDIIR